MQGGMSVIGPDRRVRARRHRAFRAERLGLTVSHLATQGPACRAPIK
jgi:hypothetical protein